MKVSGIYAIRHSPSGRTYIGSSKNIARRWAGHVGRLNAGKHHSRAMQADWSADGSEAFAIALIREVKPDDRELNEAERQGYEELRSAGVRLYCARFARRSEGHPLVPGLLRQRDLAALTQDQLAKRAGLARPTISRLEHGGEATHTTVRKLADALGCMPADLYRE